MTMDVGKACICPKAIFLFNVQLQERLWFSVWWW